MKKRETMLMVAAALALTSILGGGIAACTADDSESHTEAVEGEEREGSGGGSEHAGTGESGESGEEAANVLTKEQTFDQVRAGARLILRYDAAANAFKGTVENTTDATLVNVRGEVHLSNGIELGPTTPVDLTSGQVTSVTLPASTQPFDTWNPHAEVGPQGAEEGGEHAGDGEGEGSGEHGDGSEREGSSEHSSREGFAPMAGCPTAASAACGRRGAPTGRRRR